MKLAISLSSLTSEILAQSALRFRLDGRRPALLTPDQRPAIARIALSGFSFLLLPIARYLTDCCIPEVDADGVPTDDILWFEADIPANVAIPLRLLVEHALTAFVNRDAWTTLNPAIADLYDADLRRLQTSIASLLTTAAPARLRPCY